MKFKFLCSEIVQFITKICEIFLNECQYFKLRYRLIVSKKVSSLMDSLMDSKIFTFEVLHG